MMESEDTEDEPVRYNTYCCSEEKKVSLEATSFVIGLMGVLKIILSIAFQDILGNINSTINMK